MAKRTDGPCEKQPGKQPNISPKTSPGDEFAPFDWQALAAGGSVIGVDEVGRGCLAGPVYAAAAIVPNESVDALIKIGVTDSKLLSSAKRERLSLEILQCCHVGIGFATAEEIDTINILQASFLAMRRALRELQKEFIGAPFGPNNAHLLIDGNQRIPMRGTQYAGDSFVDLQSFAAIAQTTLIKGDLRALPIAAASIVAKVTRDQVMRDAALEYPQYGFEGHKGYAAAVHREAIAKHGPTPIHRKTFGGVREYLR